MNSLNVLISTNSLSVSDIYTVLHNVEFTNVYSQIREKYSLVALISRTKVTRLTQMAKKEDAKNKYTIDVFSILRSVF